MHNRKVVKVLTLDDFDLKGKTVFVRMDMNCPIDPETGEILGNKNIAHILVDTAGRRDLMHMRFTTKTAFIRFVGANHPSDAIRLEAWVERIATWKDQGLENLYFFIHQNVEKESPLLASRFIEKINKSLGLKLTIPLGQNPQQNSLF